MRTLITPTWVRPAGATQAVPRDHGRGGRLHLRTGGGLSSKRTPGRSPRVRDPGASAISAAIASKKRKIIPPQSTDTDDVQYRSDRLRD